jgi:hypothetical protein
MVYLFGKSYIGIRTHHQESKKTIKMAINYQELKYVKNNLDQIHES